MDISAILFYLMSFIIVVCAMSVVLMANPIFSALFLALTMISLAFVFFLLEAYFIAGVQLIVYAGAVIVLFVMVLMLFDLKKEEKAFSVGPFSGAIKIGVAGFLCGLLGGAIYMSTEMIVSNPSVSTTISQPTTKELAKTLFSKYLFAFEALGLLLLLIAIGAVAVSRIIGGTHARPQ